MLSTQDCSLGCATCGFAFLVLLLCTIQLTPTRGVWELKREGGLHPILSPTKMKVRQNSFDCLSFCSSSCLSASLSACLPVFLPFYLPYGLSCFPIFFLFPLFPSFFLEIYSPTPFTVRRQGGLLDPPDPPSQTPLVIDC